MLIYIVLLATLFTTPSWAEKNEELFNFSKKQEEVLVVKAAHSDVIVLENGQRVKMIGVESTGDPPRKYAQYDKEGRIIEEESKEVTIPIEEQAMVYAQDLLEGKKVKLEYDIESRSNDGYRYAYVYLPDGRMANVEMLRMGFVNLRIMPPNVKHADELRMAYQEAKKEKRGLQGE